jgi:hypothetical protein
VCVCCVGFVVFVCVVVCGFSMFIFDIYILDTHVLCSHILLTDVSGIKRKKKDKNTIKKERMHVRT